VVRAFITLLRSGTDAEVWLDTTTCSLKNTTAEFLESLPNKCHYHFIIHFSSEASEDAAFQLAAATINQQSGNSISMEDVEFYEALTDSYEARNYTPINIQSIMKAEI